MPDIPDDSIEIVVRRLKQAVGHNDKDQSDSIDQDQGVLVKNVIATRKGKLKTRSGCTAVADDKGSTRIDSLGHLYIQGGDKIQTMFTNGIWYARVAGVSTWSSIKTGLTIGQLAAQLTAGGKIYLSDGTNNVWSYNGSVVADQGNTNTSFPKFKFGIYHQNRAIVGTDTNSIFYVSDPLAVETWDRAAVAFKVSDQDNGVGKALVELALLNNTAFLYFKDNSVYTVDTSSTTIANWTKTVLDPIHGCVATRTAIPIGSGELLGGVLYLSKDTSENGENKYAIRSVKRTIYGSHVPGPIMSDDIETILNSMNPVYDQFCCAKFHNNKFMIAFPSSSSVYNDTIAVLDFNISNIGEGKFKWSIITGWNPAIFDDFNENDLNSLYFGDASANSQVFKAFSGTSDNGTAIDAKVTGRAEDGDFPEINKTFEFVEVFFDATDESLATVRAIFDDGDPQTLGTVSLQSSGPNLPIALPFDLQSQARLSQKFPLDNGIARNVTIEVENDTLDKSMEYLGYVLTGWAENLSFRE